jgi:prepilin-type N-terminal cleavage/methylation domain-containing protein
MINFNKKIKKNKGFTYVELIVVLSIFAIMTSLIMFNYGAYQAQVDIKVMANDIALKIVQAQKNAVNGLDNGLAFTGKPSYGVYFPGTGSTSDTSFIYFADLNNNHLYNEGSLSTVNITKGDYIKSIMSCASTPCPDTPPLSDLVISFIRPSSGAFFYNNSTGDIVPSTNYYIEITIQSSGTNPSHGYIDIYPSGRIQVK